MRCVPTRAELDPRPHTSSSLVLGNLRLNFNIQGGHELWKKHGFRSEIKLNHSLLGYIKFFRQFGLFCKTPHVIDPVVLK